MRRGEDCASYFNEGKHWGEYVLLLDRLLGAIALLWSVLGLRMLRGMAGVPRLAGAAVYNRNLDTAIPNLIAEVNALS